MKLPPETEIHEVCERCSKKCKKPDTYWSGMMPDYIFCDQFEEIKE